VAVIANTCSVDECERPAKTRGWCIRHYTCWQRNGSPTAFVRRTYVSGTPQERFESSTTKTDGCWLWTGRMNHGGYGMLSLSGGEVRAHRWAYELFIGPVPDGLVLDHLCRVRHCVNPAHLDPCTIGENVMRGETLVADQVRRTHCPQGHEYTPENTRINNGSRHCRECARVRDRSRAPRRKKKVA